jgi:hypothetical protein
MPELPEPHIEAMNSAGVDARETLFWELAGPLLAEPGVTRSTMMGYPCLRANGAFFACVEPATGHLVVKLPALRVNELVATGQALPFAPNGRTFREWAAFPLADPGEWNALLAEARSFVVRQPRLPLAARRAFRRRNAA